eukprot:766985-Hanusia_phi.AAC.7
MDDKTLNVRSMSDLAGGGDAHPTPRQKRAGHVSLHTIDHLMGAAIMKEDLPAHAFIDESLKKKNAGQAAAVRCNLWNPVLYDCKFGEGTEWSCQSTSRNVGACEVFIGNHDAPCSVSDEDFTGLKSRRKKVDTPTDKLALSQDQPLQPPSNLSGPPERSRWFQELVVVLDLLPATCKQRVNPVKTKDPHLITCSNPIHATWNGGSRNIQFPSKLICKLAFPQPLSK